MKIQIKISKIIIKVQTKIRSMNVLKKRKLAKYTKKKKINTVLNKMIQ